MAVPSLYTLETNKLLVFVKETDRMVLSGERKSLSVEN